MEKWATKILALQLSTRVAVSFKKIHHTKNQCLQIKTSEERDYQDAIWLKCSKMLIKRIRKAQNIGSNWELKLLTGGNRFTVSIKIFRSEFHPLSITSHGRQNSVRGLDKKFLEDQKMWKKNNFLSQGRHVLKAIWIWLPHQDLLLISDLRYQALMPCLIKPLPLSEESQTLSM